MWTIYFTVIAVIAAGVPVYVFPQRDELRHADAIMVLGGPGYERYPYAFELAAAGWAPAVAVSNPIGAADPWLTEYCAQTHPGFTLHCFVPDPPTTSGEARELGRLAKQYGWRTIIVVTFRPHISRARYILEHCVDAELIMVDSPTHVSALRWVREYGYQTAGFARAALHGGC
ncbi:YdcF family protein [Gordonia hankookensis]|uniref:YdcF family protein n=2 Tax=Gordonia hankookensis TaxID=589403 RepID=A0ABR7W895_9ACTN|nr:YdcF family protein [Gordonia hankookensis]